VNLRFLVYADKWTVGKMVNVGREDSQHPSISLGLDTVELPLRDMDMSRK
jgi:hypothetical protein